MTDKNALILVDLQNDFCPGGSLAVPAGDEVIVLANKLIPKFDMVVATQDWHPADHVSFAANHPGRQVGDVIHLDSMDQIMWPVHCVQATRGAEFHIGLNVEKIDKIFHKGADARVDSYSAFYDNAHLRSTGLGDYLRSQGVIKVYVMGLATDYCVKFSVLDAIKSGFEVTVIVDACRAVDLHSGDSEKALAEMQAAGAILTKAAHVFI